MAIKSLSLRSMADWKQLELFEKEAKAMRQLSHSGIPTYIDYFEVDSNGDRGYFLVQASCSVECWFLWLQSFLLTVQLMLYSSCEIEHVQSHKLVPYATFWHTCCLSDVFGASSIVLRQLSTH